MLIKQLRKREDENGPQFRVPYMPFNFNTLLNYMSQKAYRDKLLDKIETSEFDPGEISKHKC